MNTERLPAHKPAEHPETSWGKISGGSAPVNCVLCNLDASWNGPSGQTLGLSGRLFPIGRKVRCVQKKPFNANVAWLQPNNSKFIRFLTCNHSNVKASLSAATSTAVSSSSVCPPCLS